MTVMAPVRASCGPPETGASTQPMPCSALSRAAACRVPSGSAVERSITSFTEPAPAAMPSSAKTQASTAAICRTQSITTSLAAATAAGEAAAIAPCGTTVSSRSGSRFQTVT